MKVASTPFAAVKSTGSSGDPIIALDADNTTHKLIFAAMDKSTGNSGDLVVAADTGNTTHKIRICCDHQPKVREIQ